MGRRAGILHSSFTKILSSKYICSRRSLSTGIKPVHALQNDSKPIKQDQINVSKSPKDSILTDSFGRKHTYLRISLSERCNLRCQYCMPAEGVKLTEKSKLLTTEEILKLSSLFAREGITKVRLTGGEPTINKELPYIIGSLKSTPGVETVAMTTNGVVLTRLLPSLQREGLDQINISLDSLKPERYSVLTRRPSSTLPKVLAAIDLAIQLGYSPVKVNVVLMRGVNEDEAVDFVSWTKDKPVDVRFIEYMPFTGNKWETEKMVPFADLLATIKKAFPDLYALENHPNDTSKAYKVPGYSGQVGFITSMTEHFCSSCNRLRLMADGSLKVCLFGNKEVSLRDALRSGCSEDDLLTMISLAVSRKKKQHAGMMNLAKMPNRPMILIGDVYQRLLKTSWRMYLLSNPIGAIARQMSTGSGNSSDQTDGERLTHVNSNGSASMVDIGAKVPSKRVAVAEGTVVLGNKVWRLIKDNEIAKGDALGVAKLAGIMAAKRTHHLIPLCHPVPLNHVWVDINLSDDCCTAVVVAGASVSSAATGVEMEALTAVSVACLTLYDMCKAVNKSIVITNIHLLRKTGGKSGDYIYHNGDT